MDTKNAVIKTTQHPQKILNKTLYESFNVRIDTKTQSVCIKINILHWMKKIIVHYKHLFALKNNE